MLQNLEEVGVKYRKWYENIAIYGQLIGYLVFLARYAIAPFARPSACPLSACLSVTRVDQPKTV